MQIPQISKNMQHVYDYYQIESNKITLKGISIVLRNISMIEEDLNKAGKNNIISPKLIEQYRKKILRLKKDTTKIIAMHEQVVNKNAYR